jgi:hypothetical protein
MSKESVRETVAVLGVIASLLFVGYEIRNNTIAARASAYQAIGVATAAAFDNATHDREWLLVSQKSPEAMDATDWMQYSSNMSTFARLGETVLLQVEQGLLPADAMNRLGYRRWTSLLQYPKSACVWPAIRPGVSTSFREYVENSQDPNKLDCRAFNLPQMWKENYFPSS